MLNTYYLEKLISASETRLQGVQILMQGYLPISLVEPAVLRTTIRSITRKLKSKYPLFRVAYSSLFDYYRTPGVLFSHTNNFLYIQLRVPLVHKAGLMHIYRTQSFPIPVENADPDTYTQIEGIPPYFAVSPDGTHHATLSEIQYHKCHTQGSEVCFQLITMTPHTSPSCASALYHNQHENIMAQCSVRYITNHKVPPSIVDLGKGRLLIQSVSKQWTKTCEGQVPVEMEVCPFCVIELACGCELRNSNIYIPPSLSNCTDASSRTLVTQTPNLPYISSFYKRPNNSLSHLYRESYDTRDLPSFTISAAEWDTFAAADREMLSDMGKIVNMLNNDSQIYYTPVDYLLDTSFHGFTPTSRYAIVFIQIFGLGTLLLTLAFAATNYIRTRRLSAALMTLTMSLPKTTANPIRPILRDNSLALSETKIYHSIVALAIALIVLQTLYVLYRVLRRTRCGQQIMACCRQRFAIASPISIYIELSTTKESVMLAVTRIAYTQSAVYFADIMPLTNLHVIPGCVVNRLQANWSPLFISVNPENPIQLRLPAEMTIPIGLGTTVARIVSLEHFVRILVGTNRTRTVVSCGPPNATTPRNTEF